MDAALLEGIPLFAKLGDDQRAMLAERMQEVDVPLGSHLVKEGDFGYRFFAILDGTAAVTHDGRHVATLQPGDIFGEMALLEDERRTADVVATSAMRLATMMIWDFRTAMDQFPELEKQIQAVVDARMGRS